MQQPEIRPYAANQQQRAGMPNRDDSDRFPSEESSQKDADSHGGPISDGSANQPPEAQSPEAKPVGSHDEFVLRVIEVQSRLYAYILSLVLNKERAKDIVQQTNLVLLEKETEFQPGTNFAAWAYRVAFYEVLADRRKRQRDKHLFSDELLALIATRSATISESLDERSAALSKCLQELSGDHRENLLERYRPGGGVADLAEKLNKSPAAVSAMLYRIRTTLVECVERKLSGQATHG